MDNAVYNRNGYIVIKEKVTPVRKILVCGYNNSQECGQVYAWLLLDLQATPEADKSARVTLGTLLTKLNNSLKVNEIV